MSGTIRLYHGTASLDAVLREGLSPDMAGTVFDGEFGSLSTHGGVYLTTDIACAAAFASRAAPVAGANPAVVMVEVDPATLVADEDVLAAVAEKALGRERRDLLASLDGDQLSRAVANGGLDDGAVEMARILGMPKSKVSNGLALRYLDAHLRGLGDDETSDALVTAALDLSRAAPATVDEGWSRSWGFEAMNVRVVDAAVPVLGWVELVVDGDRVEAVQSGGDATGDEVEEASEWLAQSMEFGNPDFDPALPEFSPAPAP